MSLILSQAVNDIRGNQLVAANTDLQHWADRHLFTQDYLKKQTKFKEAVGFYDDCMKVFEREPYDKVLEKWTPSFREWLGETYAPSVIFEELRLIKTTDPYSYQHILTIAVVGARLLEIWIKSAPTLRRSFQALVCHRLGKARLQANLLQKKEELDEAEKKVIFEQPMVGFVLNACYWGGGNHLCAKVALQHQEDRAGKGYPAGIKTNSLLLDIIHVLDRFDALISERPFRFKKFTPRQAVDIIQQDVIDHKVEEDVLKAFTDLLRSKRAKNYKQIKMGTIGRPEKSLGANSSD